MNIFSKRVDFAKASDIREILKVTERPEVISFAGGLPAPELFPVEEMRAVLDAVLRENGSKALQYGTTEGYTPLREIIAERMLRVGVEAKKDNILVLTGSQQGLDLTGKVFLDEGDTVACESPTYLAAISAFRVFLPRYVEIEMDEEGMKMDHLEMALEKNPKIKIIYTVPDFQNPTGRTMSLDRRKKLVELANRYEKVVIEDNPYGELRFEGERLPSVKSLDTQGRVVHQSTFSKTLCPGLRVGWICASPEIFQKYVLFKQGTDLHTNTLSQFAIVKFLEMFDLSGHVENIKVVYKKRRSLMIDCIKKEFPAGIKHTCPQGGLFLWVELPSHLNSRDILVKCLENNVAFVPGGSFFANGNRENTFRLNFSNSTEDRIVEGIKRMATVLKEYI